MLNKMDFKSFFKPRKAMYYESVHMCPYCRTLFIFRSNNNSKLTDYQRGLWELQIVNHNSTHINENFEKGIGNAFGMD